MQAKGSEKLALISRNCKNIIADSVFLVRFAHKITQKT